MSDLGWTGVEVRHLVALCAVADAGTISRAAEQLGYTQSAVSQQVAALERAVGSPVFDRPGGPRPLVLTEVGTVLLEHARAVLTQLRVAEAEVRSVAGGERGTLRVGTIQSVGTRVLPAVVRRFHQDRPGVRVTLRESHDPAELLDLVDAGELDVTFAEGAVDDPRFRAVEVLVDPFVVVAPATSPEAARPSIGAAELGQLPFVGFRSDACCSTSAAFEALELAPTFVFQSDDNTTIQGCVGAGLGYALVPLLTVAPGDPTVRLLAIEPAPPPRIISLAWPADRREPPSIAAFLASVQAVCDDIATEPAAAAPVPA
jgi:DNA-binding transcriptional LysR family regulator